MVDPRTLLQRLLLWLPFWVFLAWYWQPPQLDNTLTAWGDALEVIWGIEWFRDRITTGQPWAVYPDLYHPQGFHLGTFAHTPLFFLLTTPLAILLGTSLTYHIVSLVPFTISYGTATRLFRDQQITLTIGASLVYTFAFIHTFRSGVHQNIMWMLALLPLLALYSQRVGEPNHTLRSTVIASGVSWGLINNFSLYGVFIGALLVLFIVGLQSSISVLERVKAVVSIGLIALAVSLPTLVPYWLASQTSQATSTHISIIAGTGNDPFCLLAPQPFHPITPLAPVESALCPRFGMGGLMRYGFFTTVLALLCIARRWQDRLTQRWFALAVAVSVLSLGPFLIFRSQFVEADAFGRLNHGLWWVGNRLKPELFGGENMVGVAPSVVPLPSYLLLIFAPFFEAARTMERYALLGFLAMVQLGFFFLRHQPRWLATSSALVWVFLTIPPQPSWFSFSEADLHPAYRWVAEQPNGKGYIDLIDSAEIPGHNPYQLGDVYPASLYTGKPSASRTGGSPPLHTHLLIQELVANAPGQRTASLLAAYNIGYVLLHHADDAQMQPYAASPYFEFVGCYDGQPETVWNRPICIAAVNAPQFDVLPDYTWSVEPWGAWLTNTRARSEFATWQSQSMQLSFETFPFCIDDAQQHIRVLVNGTTIGEHHWNDDACATAQLVFEIPAQQVQVGWNELLIESAYAIAPNALDAANPDPRTLALGINWLRLEPSNP